MKGGASMFPALVEAFAAGVTLGKTLGD